jgi:hypothetical protein
LLSVVCAVATPGQAIMMASTSSNFLQRNMAFSIAERGKPMAETATDP